MTTIQTVRPAWYMDEDDTAWSKVKAAFRRDWQQTKHDFGGNEANLNQQAGDTVAQATGSKSVPPGNAKTPHSKNGKIDAYYDEDEPAYRVMQQLRAARLDVAAVVDRKKNLRGILAIEDLVHRLVSASDARA